MATIGSSVTVDGELACDEALRVDGCVRGQILARDAELIVGPSARIEADVRALKVLVLGTVHGNITASQRIELGASARVTGSLSANIVVLADGARFTGRIDMDKRTIAAKIARYKAEHAVAPVR